MTSQLQLINISISVYSYVSVCPSAWNNSTLTGRIFVKFDISAFFENLWRKKRSEVQRREGVNAGCNGKDIYGW